MQQRNGFITNAYCTLVSEVFTKRKRLMVNARLRVAMMNLNIDPQATVCAV